MEHIRIKKQTDSTHRADRTDMTYRTDRTNKIDRTDRKTFTFKLDFPGHL